MPIFKCLQQISSKLSTSVSRTTRNCVHTFLEISSLNSLISKAISEKARIIYFGFVWFRQYSDQTIQVHLQHAIGDRRVE